MNMESEIQKELILAAKNFAGQIVDAPLHQLGGLLSDQIGYWRFKNKINTLLKTEEFLRSKGINPKKVLPEIFVPLIDKAGDTDNETLLTMYSRLLAQHVDENHEDDVHPSFAKILSNLSYIDVQILNALYNGILHQDGDHRKLCTTISEIKKEFPFTDMQVKISFENFWRLRICDHGDTLHNMNGTQQIVFTDFGWHFIRACNYK